MIALLKTHWKECAGFTVWLLVVWLIWPTFAERATELRHAFISRTQPAVECSRAADASDAEIMQCYLDLPAPADTLTDAEQCAILRQYDLEC